MVDDLRGDEYIDSRDVIERMEELEAEIESAESDVELAEEERDDAQTNLDAMDGEGEGLGLARVTLNEAIDEVQRAQAHLEECQASEELAALKELASEAEGYGDWSHGEQLVREDKFEEYAEELASDVASPLYVASYNGDAPWPLNHIDWEAAADELKIDYMTVTFAGNYYLMRA